MSEMSPIKRALLRITQLERELEEARAPEPIAVVGLACRFPGGVQNLRDLWQVLERGTDAIGEVPPSRWNVDDYFDANGDAAGKTYSRFGGFLEQDVYAFDASLFGISPLEAVALDPQQRLLLELTWEAIEDAGVPADELRGTQTGVFVGISAGDYASARLRSGDCSVIGPYDVTGNIGSTAAGRLAYTFDFRGPAVAIDTACSSSLVALDLACASLRQKTSGLAVAGAVSLVLSPEGHISFSKMRALAPDGRCRTFDAAASGFVRAEGAGVLLLQPLRDAVAAGRRVLAVIRGSAVNQDGRSNGLTAPNLHAQNAVVAEALRRAGITAEDLDYIEAHGTGTPLGDPIELEALAGVFRERTRPLPIGSVKTNFGHLESAAGMAGIAKIIAALRNEAIPPNLHFTKPTPHFEWERSPLVVPTERMPWPANEARPRRASISSFGFSGTNAHLVLEEAPPREVASAVQRPADLLLMTAHSEMALAALASKYVELLQGDASFPDVCAASRTRRSHLPHRLAVAGVDAADVVARLRDGRTLRGRSETNARVTFVFSGQGSQYAGMARGLYKDEPVFAAAFNRCAELFAPALGTDLRTLIFESDDDARLESTLYTQPALFAVEWALYELWRSRGVEPAAVVGHSIGEYVAATVAGVFTLEDACRLVGARAKLLDALPRNGAMAAVFADRATVESLLAKQRGQISIAAVNGPRNVVVSGERDAVAALIEEAAASKIDSRALRVSHAFHSPLVEPALDELHRVAASITASAPRIPLYSNVTGEPMTVAPNASYWSRHARLPVRFADSIAAIANGGSRIFLEVSPSPTLAPHGREVAPDSVWIASLRRGANESLQMLEALGALWTRGVSFDRDVLGTTGADVALPTYPFDRVRYFADPVPRAVAATVPQHAAPQAEEAPMPQSRTETLVHELIAIVRESSGTSHVPADASLLDIGLDSLMLMQVRHQITRKYGVEIAISDFFESLSSVERIATHLAAVLPAEEAKQAGVPVAQAAQAIGETGQAGLPLLHAVAPKAVPVAMQSAPANVSDLFAQQVAAMSALFEQQLAVLRGGEAAQSAPSPIAPTSAPNTAPRVATKTDAFVPYKAIDTTRNEARDARQRAHLDTLIGRYVENTRESKELTGAYRTPLANNRNIAGFRPAWKEMIYQIVSESASGSRIRAAGGRELIDFTMGFGVHLFGHGAPFITAAIERELQKGMPLGPMYHLAGEVAQAICEMTGFERVAFYNSGSEAVMVAMRVARTVTGRNKIVLFEGSYHGSFDGVLALRRVTDGEVSSVPGSPGTTQGFVDDVIVLRYDDPESLDVIRKRGAEIAAVLVEPVQSRRPDVQPRQFLHDLRALTTEVGAALIFDEVVSGFRVHPGGAQAVFGVRADLATYGKVIGGGMPVGLVAGRADFMDAIDGGAWSFGDDSVPRKRNTFVAGTFCHHPLTLASMRAVLDRLREEGPALQENLNRRTAAFCEGLNRFFEEEEVPIRVSWFGSLFRFVLRGDLELLFFHLIERGFYIWEGRNCFVSTAHTDEDLARFHQAIVESIAELRDGGYIPPRQKKETVAATACAIAPQLETAPATASSPMQFSLFFFSSNEAEQGEKYRLLLDAAKAADRAGFTAVWTPERHFHDFGGIYPNPVVTSAAIAAVTERIRIRAGSTVLLLHDPVRFAENWSMVDNLSAGRVDLALALGWNSNDFALAPENFERRTQLFPEHLDTVQRLWRGEAVARRGGKGEEVRVSLHPRPVQAELPVWFVAPGNPETFVLAGERGANVLTYLEGQTVEQLAERIALYRDARRRAGHAGPGHVTLMLHTFVGSDLDEARATVRGPLTSYLETSLFLRTQLVTSLGLSADDVTARDRATIVTRAVERYISSSSLIGTRDSLRPMVETLARVGVDELGCLVDFGLDYDTTMRGLEQLTALKDDCQATRDTVPLSAEQKELWTVAHIDSAASEAYHESVLLRVAGTLDETRLRDAVAALMARHESLRVVSIDGETQRIATTVEPPLETAEGETSDAFLEEVRTRPFDLTAGPLFRVALARAGDESRLLIVAHHIVANGWSLGLMVEELATLYSGATYLPAATTLAEYIRWQRDQRASAASDEAFWIAKLLDMPPAVLLPGDATEAGRDGMRETAIVDGELAAALRVKAREQGVTLFMLMLAGFELLVARISGARRFVTAVPVSGQAAMGAPVLVGQCTSMLPSLFAPEGESTLADVLQHVRTDVLDLQRHASLSFADAATRNVPVPRYEVMFNMDRVPPLPRFGELAVEPLPVAATNVKFPLSANVLDFGNRLQVDVDVATAYAPSLSRWVRAYLDILRAIAGDTNVRAFEVPLRDEAEAVAPHRSSHSVNFLAEFEQHARNDGDAPAIADAVSLSRSELLDEVHRVASLLRAHGVEPGQRVAFFVRDPWRRLTCCLAAMHVGAVRMEAATGSVPALLRMLEEAELVITEAQFVGQLPHARVVAIEASVDADGNVPPHLANASDVAAHYFIEYESLVLTHGELARQVGMLAHSLALTATDVVAFDEEGVLEVALATLAAGGVLTRGTTGANVTVAALELHALRDYTSPATLRHLVVLGGHVAGAHLEAIRARGVEHIHVVHRVTGLPIALAIRDARDAKQHDAFTLEPLYTTRVVDDRNRSTILGAVGAWQIETLNGTCTLADRARVAEDGRIRWRGTPDHLALIGREIVDLREVEAHLLRHAADAVAVVQVVENEQSSLVAYVVLPPHVRVSQLRRELLATMPPRLIPSYFVRVASIDAAQRLYPWQLVVEGGTLESGVDAPKTPLEQTLVSTFRAILGRDVAVDDDFFALGAQSLHTAQLLARLRSTLGAEVGTRELLAHPTVRTLASFLGGTAHASEPIPRVEPAEHYPLSHAQHRVWLQQQLVPEMTAYNIPAAAWLDAHVKGDAVRDAIAALVERHESLRTTFITEDGDPLQKISEAAAVDFEELDLRACADPLAEVERRIAAEWKHRFDLACGPLMRVKLLRFEKRAALMLNMHHIVSDGWSIGVLVEEIGAILASGAAALPPLELQYKDFAAWHSAAAEQDERSRKFWLDTFTPLPAPLPLRTDFDRPPVRNYAGSSLRSRIDARLATDLRRLASEQRVSVVSVLVAAQKALLHRLTGSSDVVIGVPVTGRVREELERQVGFYVNVVGLRDSVAGDMTFRELLTRVAATAADAFDHGDYPFNLVVRDLDLVRDWSRAPLFDVLTTWDDEVARPDGFALEPIPVTPSMTLFDLVFRFSSAGEEIAFELEYDTALFRAESVALMQERYLTLLRRALAAPGARLRDLDYTTTEERAAGQFRLGASFRL